MNGKLVEILITVSFNRRENKLFQHFYFGKQKNIKYLTDTRFTFRRLFNEKVVEHSLIRDEECEYVEKRDLKDEVVLVYETTKKTLPISYYFKVVDFVAPNAGCKYCIHKKPDELICIFQNNKVLKKELINCSFFSQKRITK
jgi:hypothetical protein